MTYYKATKPDGTDFRTGTIDYAAACGTETLIKHPGPYPSVRSHDAMNYFSVTIDPTMAHGMKWPCRLFEVLPVGEQRKDPNMMAKFRCLELQVVKELPAHLVFGPNGAQVVAEMERYFNNCSSGKLAELTTYVPTKEYREAVGAHPIHYRRVAEEALTDYLTRRSHRDIPPVALRAFVAMIHKDAYEHTGKMHIYKSILEPYENIMGPIAKTSETSGETMETYHTHAGRSGYEGMVHRDSVCRDQDGRHSVLVIDPEKNAETRQVLTDIISKALPTTWSRLMAPELTLVIDRACKAVQGMFVPPMEEPKELGSVVLDEMDRKWVRASERDGTPTPWYCAAVGWRSWQQINSPKPYQSELKEAVDAHA